MEVPIGYLSGLLVGIILAVACLFFVMWRFQRMYNMMTMLGLDMRNLLVRIKQEVLTNAKPSVNVKLTADLEKYRVQMKEALELLNKAVDDD